MKPTCRDAKPWLGSGLTWYFGEQHGLPPSLPPREPLAALSRCSRESSSMPKKQWAGNSPEKEHSNVKARKRIGIIGSALIAALLTSLAFAASAVAKLTGEFTKFQHCPHHDSEVDFSVEAFSRHVRELFENPFLGAKCYVGSMTKTARAPIPTELTTRTNALSRLTLSPA